MEILRQGGRPTACVRLTRFDSGGWSGHLRVGLIEERSPLVQFFLTLSKNSPFVDRRRGCPSVETPRNVRFDVLMDPAGGDSPRGSGNFTKGGCWRKKERQGRGPGRGGWTARTVPGAPAASDTETRDLAREGNLAGPVSPSIGIDPSRPDPGSRTRGPAFGIRSSRAGNAGAALRGTGRGDSRRGTAHAVFFTGSGWEPYLEGGRK